MRKIFQSNIFIALISIFFGFLVGALVLKVSGFSPIEAYGIMFNGVFGKLSYVSNSIIKATPLIFTGLSVAFAFKTGLFNIGAEGQFIIGAVTSAVLGYFLNLPAYLLIPVVIMGAMIVSALWGALAGFLKSKFGVHEVISTIMLNWIALYLHNYIIFIEKFHKPDSEASFSIHENASIAILRDWKISDQGMAYFENHPYLMDLLKPSFNAGIFIAIIAAIVIAYILNKTTLGFELRAVGKNTHAAEYAGVDVKKSMTTSMAIAGALAGLGGALHVLGVSENVSLLAAMEGYGFDGIAVALIGNSNPIACVFSGLFFGALKYGGTKIQSALSAPSEVISIVIGTIVFFVAIPKLIKILTNKISKEVKSESR